MPKKKEFIPDEGCPEHGLQFDPTCPTCSSSIIEELEQEMIDELLIEEGITV